MINPAICKRCQYSWISRVEEIKECPRCKSRNWDKQMTFGEAFKKIAKEIKKKKETENAQPK